MLIDNVRVPKSSALRERRTEVFVFVCQPQLKGWTLFPATIDTRPESGGKYRWRAICQFGELDGSMCWTPIVSMHL